MRRDASFNAVTAAIVAYAVAMAYLESAVVVYLDGALGTQVGRIFPLPPVLGAGTMLAIEVGREAATVVMIAAVGIIAGRSPLERLAWTAVVFGAWDIAYYGWLYVLAGWPPTLGTTDLLFLIPVPWAGPVWSPAVVSLGLVTFGLAAARVEHDGGRVVLKVRHVLTGLAGGVLVVASYTLDAGGPIGSGLPGPYPWPLFAAGMGLAALAATDALRTAVSGRQPADQPGTGARR